MMPSVKVKLGTDNKHCSSAGIIILTVAAIALTYTSPAFAENVDRAKAGLTLWRDNGCADCHGAFANGEKQRDESPTGANLRTTRLDAGALKLAISCGRPGAEMPAFGQDANTCTGQAGGELYPASRTLTPDEIESVVVYSQARIVGHGRITKAECLAYYDDQPDWCEEYK